ncbi:c2 domain-containing protein [Anaeramoeba flamelloides]|uniref:C2 domain-containing protein n=1 Tax=Anaeramoeba flamelloides TaxID=1746091 RepID=A0AAV8A5B3_9EUKA|nr:c2 domain-containing protein [Anaeramoeba flamelloides]|eukprot:Anaeramoba_flamelloidesa573628_24.p1 GENE.a573628_24~~a573628_24.p1  ORF type:complete len:300 (+),score=53.90 a573628_24:86-985(+)
MKGVRSKSELKFVLVRLKESKTSEIVYINDLLKKMKNHNEPYQCEEEIIEDWEWPFKLIELKKITKKKCKKPFYICTHYENVPETYVGHYNDLRKYLKTKYNNEFDLHTDKRDDEFFEDQDRENDKKKIVNKHLNNTASKPMNILFAMCHYIAIIRVIQGRNMPKMDKMGKCDTFLEFSCLDLKRKSPILRTSTVRKKFNPKWDVSEPRIIINLGLNGYDTRKIKCDCFDWNKIGSNVKFGSFEISLNLDKNPLGQAFVKSCKINTDPEKIKLKQQNDQPSYIDLSIIIWKEKGKVGLK